MMHIFRAIKMLSFILVLFSLNACYKPEPDYKHNNSWMPRLDPDWDTVSPVTAHIDSAAIQKAYNLFWDETKYKTSVSLLVIRNGKLVAENYCRDFRDAFHGKNIKSATKSVTSLLAGIAVDKGLLDIDKTIYSYLPDYFEKDDEKRNITVRQALQMRTGLLWNNDKNTLHLMTDEYPSSMNLILDQPMEFSPGKGFHYTDANPHLVAAVLQKVTGKTLEAFARENLFSPLGITDFYWEKHKDGINYGAVALYLTPRDFARIGQLMLQKGKWNNQQIVSEKWLQESTKLQATAAETGSADYGLYWWLRPQNNAIVANGHGGQYLYIVPDKNLLIVHTAFPYTGNGYPGITLAEIEDLANIIIAGCY